jgi:glycosyltransferase involved in cell wall biosynthesis
VLVVYFGTYERDYPRNAQVISALRGAGVDVVERHEPVWEGRHGWTAGPRTAARLALAEARLLARRPERFDALVVGYPGHPDVAVARRASRAALRRADLVVADTETNAARLAELGGLAPERLAVCLVGAEERLFRPAWSPPPELRALFVGKLIPLHGLETILAAARLAPEVPFRVVGSGQLDGLLRDRPPNVEWVEWVEYERLPEEIRAAGCVLGIFGTTAKAARVIPNKAFQALACGAPLVTADTPAARELLVDGESALLVPPGDAGALAGAVRRLRDESGLAARVAAGGLAAYREHASEAVLGRRWRELLDRVVGR